MGIKLGGESELVLYVQQGEGQEPLPLTLGFREPTAPEVQGFMLELAKRQKALAEAVDEDGKIDLRRIDASTILDLNGFLSRFAEKVLLRVEGIEGPEGVEPVAAVKTFLPEALVALGNHLASRVRKVTVGLGKSESPSEPSSRDASARSTELPAST